MTYPEMRIGIDLGGTKIEALALDRNGNELLRYRVDTPRNDYAGTVAAIAGSRAAARDRRSGSIGSVGAGIPGSAHRGAPV